MPMLKKSAVQVAQCLTYLPAIVHSTKLFFKLKI